MSIGEYGAIRCTQEDRVVTGGKTMIVIVPEPVKCGLGEQKISQRLNISKYSDNRDSDEASDLFVRITGKLSGKLYVTAQLTF